MNKQNGFVRTEIVEISSKGGINNFSPFADAGTFTLEGGISKTSKIPLSGLIEKARLNLSSGTLAGAKEASKILSGALSGKDFELSISRQDLKELAKLGKTVEGAIKSGAKENILQLDEISKTIAQLSKMLEISTAGSDAKLPDPEKFTNGINYGC